MYTKGIFSNYLYLPLSEIQTPVGKLKVQLTAIPKYPELASIPMYDESRSGYFGIPRYYGVDYSTIKDLNTEELSLGFECKHKFTSKLRSNQTPLYEEFKESISEGKTGFILKARTGLGKTVLLLKFIENLGRNALIIVPTQSLLSQWKKMIVEHTSYSESDIGHVQANIVDYKDKPIVIGMIQSLCKDKYGEGFKKYFGVVVYDEVHRTSAEYFSKVIPMFSALYRIGASATIDRSDGLDVVFRNHIGEKTISLGSEREKESRPKILVVGYEGAGNYVPSWAAKLPIVRRRGVILSALAKDKKRSEIVISTAVKLASSGRRVLVLSDRIEQLKYMSERTDVMHKPGLFISVTSKKDKQEVLRNSGILYATFGVFALGMDLPDLAGLVFATPQSRIRQPVGRITRLCKDKKRPIVVDILDTDIKECLNWYRNRLLEYKHRDIKGDIIIT